MLTYILRRILILIPLLFLISLLSFFVIQLPPGDYVETYVRNITIQGGTVNEQQKAALKAEYGLDKPLPVQYWMWISRIISQGNFGNSFFYSQPVSVVLMDRVPKTIGISLVSILLTWLIAFPLGIISALKQYSIWDHLMTFISLFGLAVPGFLFALVVMYLIYQKTGWFITGFFSPEFRTVPWSFAKFLDLLKNVSLPIIILSVTGVAGIIRVLRASLLDELRKQYVTTARAKGLSEVKLIIRYPIRIAINPLISTIGWLLPAIVGGEIVVSKVLNIETTGPALLNAISAQDMYLAGAIVMILSTLTVIGTLISDILLAIADPRIRYSE